MSVVQTAGAVLQRAPLSPHAIIGMREDRVAITVWRVSGLKLSVFLGDRYSMEIS